MPVIEELVSSDEEVIAPSKGNADAAEAEEEDQGSNNNNSNSDDGFVFVTGKEAEENGENIDSKNPNNEKICENNEMGGETRNSIKTNDDEEEDDDDCFEDAVEVIPDEELIQRAQYLKAEGNVHYGKGAFDLALDSYQAAIDVCPPSAVDDLAVFHANKAAVHLRTESWPECVEECDLALEFDPDHLKSLMRRSIAHEHLEDWIKTEADLLRVKEIVMDDGSTPSTKKKEEQKEEEKEERKGEESANNDADVGGSSQDSAGEKKEPTAEEIARAKAKKEAMAKAKQAIDKRSLEKRLKGATEKANKQREKETAEMMGKLKGLGNSLLGKFGLSLDNFVTEQRDDGTYNIQFKQ